MLSTEAYAPIDRYVIAVIFLRIRTDLLGKGRNSVKLL